MLKYINEFPIKNETYIDDTPTTIDQLGLDIYQSHTGYNAISKRQNWLENFRSINNKFINWCSKYLKWNIYVPFREKSTVGSINEFENKGKYLGYLTLQFIKTVKGVLPLSDRDSYIFKRIDICGLVILMLLSRGIFTRRK